MLRILARQGDIFPVFRMLLWEPRSGRSHLRGPFRNPWRHVAMELCPELGRVVLLKTLTAVQGTKSPMLRVFADAERPVAWLGVCSLERAVDAFAKYGSGERFIVVQTSQLSENDMGPLASGFVNFRISISRPICCWERVFGRPHPDFKSQAKNSRHRAGKRWVGHFGTVLIMVHE
jgi:hypothetical protein